MSILNVNQIQPVGSGQTITISASDITASSATITASSVTATTITSSSTSTFSSGINVTGGSVGIGTDDPDTKLHILTNEDNILTLSHGQGAAIYGSWIRFTEGKDNHKWSLGYHDSDNTFYLSKTLDIDSGKFISINQTTEELEIRSASNNAVTITDYSASYRPSIRFAYSDAVSGVATETFKIRSEGTNGLDFYYGSTSNFAMRLDSSGNLGIGTATIRDSSKLDVDGDLYVQGNSNLIKVCHLKTDQNDSVTEGSANAFTVNFNTETYRDSDYFTHSSGVITVLKAGWYKITGNLVYQNADGSVRNTIRAYVLKNGTEITSTATYDYDRGSLYGEFSNNKIDTFLQLAADDTVAIGNYGYNIDGTVTIESAECEFIVTYFR